MYYISGYCLQSPAKLRQVCTTCMLPLVDSTVEEHSLLVTLKDYKDGVLCRVNSHVFQVFKSWEHVIRANEHRIHELRIKDKFITMCKDASIELQSQVPTFSCHPILDRLLKKYITLRIYITCRKISRSDNVIPMSSKSTAMRHMVGNIR